MKKKKQFLTVEVLKLKVTDQGVELGIKGVVVAICALIPMVILGWFAGQLLNNYLKSPVDIQILAASLLALLSGWLIFLVWHVRKMKSMTRVLLWIAAVGINMGLLAFESLH